MGQNKSSARELAELIEVTTELSATYAERHLLRATTMILPASGIARAAARLRGQTRCVARRLAALQRAEVDLPATLEHHADTYPNGSQREEPSVSGLESDIHDNRRPPNQLIDASQHAS